MSYTKEKSTYVVCQTNSCRQTYPLAYLNQHERDVKCYLCQGDLIDENGKAELTTNPIPVPKI